ncbi:MAG: transposase [Chloroflexi bacterium]|nr:transposase [Chloroflexota bacterium]
MRYSVLAQVEALILGGSRTSTAVRVVAGRDHVHLDGRPVRVSGRTIQRWRAAFLEGGMAALEPKDRSRTQTSQALSEALIAFLRDEKRRDPRASAPELLRRAQAHGIVAEDQPVDRTTLWRACRRMGLATRARPSKREGDMRRWRYPHRMQCVLCDGKHFRAGGSRARRVALFFLDDATRYGLDVRVGASESTELFLHGLYDLVRKHGLPDLLYLDHGAGFVSEDTLAVVQGGLSAWLVHGQRKYPPGRGAVERFNRTASEQILRALDGATAVDPGDGALTLRLRHYLERYNDTPHETLGGDTPRQRWEQGRALRFPEDEADLYRRFVVRQSRKVSQDHVIRMDGRLWEAPRGLGGSWVEVARHVLDRRLWVPHEGRMVELAPLDPHANATDRRGRPEDDGPLPSEGVPHTAASRAYDRDFLPLIDPQGGFPETDDDDESEEDDQT